MIPARATFLALLVAACLWPAGAAAQTPEATLPSTCLDQAVAPASVVLACADAGAITQELTWTSWGQPEATATGVLSVKTCQPSCAEGSREEYPVTLVASDLRDCSYGEPQYTLITFSFPADSP